MTSSDATVGLGVAHGVGTRRAVSWKDPEALAEGMMANSGLVVR